MEQINRFGLQMFYTADLFDAEPYDGAEDYRLFYLGDTLKSIEQEKLYFRNFPMHKRSRKQFFSVFPCFLERCCYNKGK